MASLRINRSAVLKAAYQDPRFHIFMDRVAETVTEVAGEIFEMRQRKDNEDRVSETTPPKYMSEFYTRRRGLMWFAGNSDRSAIWVEFGAMVGGNRKDPPRAEPPVVLKYRPLSTAIEVLEARGGVT